MKKKQSGDASPGQQSADYVVGQVSGSLFQKTSAAPESLSALFSSAAPAASLLFQPAPEPVQRSSEVKEQQQKEAPEVKGQTSKKKKTPKEKTAADQKLDNRESSLQNADEEEQQKTSVLKKKKKRKAAELDGENDVEQWVLKRQRLKVRKEEEAVKKNRTVFVGNLPISCTKKTLRSLFRDKGSIESIRFRSVVREDPSMSRRVAAIQRKVHPKKQSMNAYVVFKDEEGVAKALESNGMEIEKDFHIRVDRVTESSAHDHKRSVFVGNLSFEINELAFRRHFEECGGVEAVRLVRDQNSGLGKGFGYVLFESADSVQLALELDGSKLEGRSIRVKRSVKKEKQKNKSDGKGAAGKKGPMRGPAARGPGAKGPAARGPGAKGPAARGPGAKGPAARGPGAKGPAARGPGAKGPAARGPGAKGPAARGPGAKGPAARGFKSPKKFTSTKSSASFKGEMVDPNKKTKKKRLKKKVKPNKTVHI